MTMLLAMNISIALTAAALASPIAVTVVVPGYLGHPGGRPRLRHLTSCSFSSTVPPATSSFHGQPPAAPLRDISKGRAVKK